MMAEAYPMDAPRWYALSVRSRHEGTVKASLISKDLESYVPVRKERRRWSDRMQTVEVPLFSTYVFCRFSYEDRLKVLRTPSVLSVVAFNGCPTALSDEEIGRIKSIVESGNPVAPWDLICAGQRVRICEGPMSGVEGVLLREKSIYRVVVNVELLQRAVAVEVNRDCLRVLDSSTACSRVN